MTRVMAEEPMQVLATEAEILGEGSFVLAVSEGRYGPAGGKHACFYDLFRVEGGKIVEHWDTVAEIPEKKPWRHDNGKFGF